MTRILAIAAGVALIAVLGGIYLITAQSSGGDFAQCRSTAVAGGGDIGGDFTLVDETGQTVTSAEVLDQPALIYFGYTFCPDVCPLDLVRNAEATEILEERGMIVKPVFISIDPQRDTPEVVAEYTDAMHPRMLGLTGSPEQVKAASQAYRTFYKAHEPAEGEEEYYLVDHSTFTYLTLPGHGFVEFFRRDLGGEQMADKVACFLDAS
ncbi:SCO family protein [Roseovarius sp. Pro17]|uniref:SCO family protein n=1 Tax=Roseovarius sp. Pro17 TaxID=3108175 RepID=UPI002D76CAFC|nr:SCO family protein [Roseovarius sp. Pro17]